MSFPVPLCCDHNARVSIKQLRQQRGWSQEQLAEHSGLSVRTIQRIEQGRTPGLASATALANALQVDVEELAERELPERQDLRGAVAAAVRRYDDFDGYSSRPQYWWFFLVVMLLASLATLVDEAVATAVLLVFLLPLAAVGTRRLRDAGHSGWWQLLALAPFGVVVPLILLAQPTAEPPDPTSAE